MNNATFAGRLGRDAEVRTAGGYKVAGWSLAVDERGPGGEKQTLWVDCSLWGDRAEKLVEFLKKGKQIAVSGRVGIRTYEAQGETRAVITLRVAELTLLGGGERAEGERPASQASRPAPGQSTAKPPAHPSQATPQPSGDFSDDDIPF